MGFDEVDQRLPQDHHLHLREKLPLIGLLLGGGELVIQKAEPDDRGLHPSATGRYFALTG